MNGPLVEVKHIKEGDLVQVGTDDLYVVLSTCAPRKHWTSLELLDLQTGRRWEFPATTDCWVITRVEL